MDGMHSRSRNQDKKDNPNLNRKESCYEVYYIKEEALKLLLAGLGQKEWYGLFSEGRHAAQPEREAGNRILAEMYQDGVIAWEGAGAAVRQPYADMLSAMLKEKTCVTVHTPDTGLALRCCYLSGTGVVMTQVSQREAATLGMAYVSTQCWIGMLGEECARLEDGECCRLVRRSSGNGKVYQSVQIYRDGLRAFRMEWNGSGSSANRCRCAREEFAGRLAELLGLEYRFEREGACNDFDGYLYTSGGCKL